MSWYRIVLELKSPLHVGDVPLGFVQRTRRYLPARSLWGALTATKARQGAAFPEYGKIGEEIENRIKFTHFFAGVRSGEKYESGEEYEFYLPNYGREETVMYGNLTCTGFEQRFITSFGQTALDPDSLTADDHSLHEKEVISHLSIPLDRTEMPKPVLFCGYAYCENDNDAELLCLLDGCQVGADRRNGLGLVRIEGTEKKPVKMADDAKAWNPQGVTLSGNTLVIKSGTPFPCHVPIEDVVDGYGDIEFLQWRSWDGNSGAGQKGEFYCEIPCWVPGSAVKRDVTLVANGRGVFRSNEVTGNDQ